MTDLHKKILDLHSAYEKGLLGDQTMPEDTHPVFSSQEEKLAFFTLPMALNYQRDSYKLWKAATETFEDEETKQVFSIDHAAEMPLDELRLLLLKHKTALQPNKHPDTWLRISRAVSKNWGSIAGLVEAAGSDFLILQKMIQIEHKKDFPYLSGPKIFHYWSYILGEYCDVELTNREFIQIAPDTHVIQCSVRLGLITKHEAKSLTRDEISTAWRTALEGTGLNPIDMHSPLWFWSRNNFIYKI